MAQTEKINSAIKAAISAIQKRRAFQSKLQDDVRTYSKRTRKIGDGFRQRIFDKAFAAAGVKAADIKKRQRDNDASDKKFIESLVSGINKNSRKVSQRQKKLAKEMLRKPRPGKSPPGPNPPGPVVDILSTAHDISFQTFGARNTTWGSSTAPWSNLARVRITDSLFASPFRAFISFQWTPPRDGYLNALAVVAANGSYWWASEHQCIQASLYQAAGIYITVFPVSQQPDPLDCDEQTILSNPWNDFPGCSTDIGNNVVDSVFFLQHPAGVSVASGVPVVIMLVCEFYFDAVDAIGEIDFLQADKCINATGVIVNLA
jgi:hypothetical protein